MKRIIAVFIAAFVLATALPAASVQAADATQKEILIGSILPLTGAFAQTGQLLRVGEELARDLINAHTPYPVTMAGSDGIPALGHAKIRIIFADSQGKPDQAATVAEQLITQDHVVAVLGCYTSATTQTASLRAEQYKIPFLNPDSSNPQLTERGLHWFFRISPHDGTFTENMFQFMKELAKAKGWNPKRIALVHEDTLFGKGFGDVTEEIAKREGYTLAARVTYPANTSEVQSEVQKVKAANPDVIFQASYLSDSVLFMKTYKQQGINVPIIAQDAGFVEPGFIAALGKDANDIFTRDTYALNIKQRNQGVPLINELYKQRSGGKNLDGNVARDFTAVTVIADAINRAKSTDPEKIRAALAATNIDGKRTIMPWRGIKFNDHGQNIEGAGLILQIQDGQYQTVWPSFVASKPPIFPIPNWGSR
ncbi:MAG: ABC transporter substrate-binding protein [Candidatus Eremiobacteraeota bacterium]|nr:ABC transporter substrate-binding protein [Candidatus Eremiobacteraeota bacterium]